MFNLNGILVMIFIVLGAGIGHIMKEKNEEVTLQVSDSLLTTTFLLYADSLSTFKKNYPTYTGSVHAHGSLPPWLSKKPEIRMHLDQGIGYVYMPKKASLYAELMRATENSSMLGITDDHHVMTISGQTHKPPFIPKNHIVYIK